jgi:hypothetical protein
MHIPNEGQLSTRVLDCRTPTTRTGRRPRGIPIRDSHAFSGQEPFLALAITCVVASVSRHWMMDIHIHRYDARHLHFLQLSLLLLQ